MVQSRMNTHDPKRASTRWCRVASAGMAVLLTACSTSQVPDASPAAIREFAAKGYSSVEHDEVTISTHHWTLSGSDVNVVLSQPQRAGAAPLVIYLPGLGENSEAGLRWRTAWSSAGYAVLSVQPLEDDATARTSSVASGSLKAVEHARFAGAAMTQRLRVLMEVIGEAQRRAAAREPSWQGIDWNTLAVAGFDLGAYTTMVVAGEHLRESDGIGSRLPVRAAIALSPYASFSAGAFDTRYRDIHAPVLSVTSDVDTDPVGLVDGAYLRDAPFEYIRGPGNYRLSLQGLPHAGFSGAPRADATSAEHNDSATEADAKTQRHHGSKLKSPGDGKKSSHHEKSGDDTRLPAARLSPADLELRMIAAQDVSTAFLDAYVKNDPLAREWLAGDAPKW